jgi:hypothetical protein
MGKTIPKTIILLAIFVLVFIQLTANAGPLGFDFSPAEFGANILDKNMLKTYYPISEKEKEKLPRNAKGQLVLGNELELRENYTNPFGSHSLLITIDAQTNQIMAVKYQIALLEGTNNNTDLTRLHDWHKYYGQEVTARYGNPTASGTDQHGYPWSEFREEGNYKYTVSAYMMNDKLEKIPQQNLQKQIPFSDKYIDVLRGIAVFSVEIEVI